MNRPGHRHGDRVRAANAMAGTPWTDAENDAVVAAYFAMLADDLAGRPYNKAAANRNLRNRVNRSRGSIELKHQNISAVLKGLGETWIPGYRPAFHFQAALIDVVVRWLDQNPDWQTLLLSWRGLYDLERSVELLTGPPPTLGIRLPLAGLDQMLDIARKYDVAGRAERNRALGRAGEMRVFAHERAILRGAGRTDLAGRVRWVSVEDDAAGYDIESFDPEGERRLIEVKTTNGWERTPFSISQQELDVSEAHDREWCLVRVWDFARMPRAFELRRPLDKHAQLIATGFEARFD